jgi:cytochrome b involved in lipid metabolism
MKTLRLTVTGLLLITLTACSQAPLEPGASTGMETASETPTAQPSEEPTSTATETEVGDEAADPEVTEEESPAAVASKTPAATAEATTPKPAPTPSSTQTAAPSPSPTPSETTTVAGYTKAQVAQKNSRTACWVIVSGSVYNLTDWINKHPGGAGALASLCGTDATASFEAQHGGQARPSSTLDAYYLGPLVD